METILPKFLCNKNLYSKEDIIQRFSLCWKYPIEIKINDNRSTFLSVLMKSRQKLRVSIHRMFLNAPEELLEKVIRFCVHGDKKALPLLKKYAHQFYMTEDYSYKARHLNSSVGKCYNLQEIFERICIIYFQKKLPLRIAYFPKPRYKKSSGITFGSYDHGQKLIRINALLDDPFYPLYFVEFVIYHEILHYIFPMRLEENRRILHGAEFKRHEKKFCHYAKAKLFEKTMIRKMLHPRKRYGRT